MLVIDVTPVQHLVSSGGEFSSWSQPFPQISLSPPLSVCDGRGLRLSPRPAHLWLVTHPSTGGG